MRFFYNLSIYFYLFAIHIASLFNSKARLWINGRKSIFKTIQLSIHKSLILNPESSIIWVHCASLGEFEQGRPLIEKLKIKNEKCKIILTFFSPSGYEIRKNYADADYIFYLPIDTPNNAEKFIELIKPKAAFFVKYEFWFNYLNALKEHNIPTYLISGVFRKEHYFFKGYGSWFRKQLSCFTHFFLQDEISAQLLNSIGYANTTVAGDTRFDRVNEVSKNVNSIPFIEQFKQGKKVLIAGSSWKEDEELISNYKLQITDLSTEAQLGGQAGFKLIIVPHEIHEDHIQSIISLFHYSKVVRYSRATEQNIKTADVLIIDNIGMLSSLYQYGTIAFIGGGFGKGIHNILEAATFGLPVIFGPNYQKFSEAKELIRLGGAYTVKNINELKETLQLLSDKDVLQTASYIAKQYVQSRVGATDKILKSIGI